MTRPTTSEVVSFLAWTIVSMFALVGPTYAYTSWTSESNIAPEPDTPESPSKDEIEVAGDGSGDTTSIAEAVQQVDPNGTVTIGPGDFRLPSSLIIDKDLTILGSGSGQTRLIGDGESSTVHIRAATVKLEDLSILGNEKAEEAALVLTDSIFQLTRLEVANGGTNGVDITGRSSGTATSLLTQGNADNGVVVQSSSSVEIDQSISRANGTDGFRWSDQATGTIKNSESWLNDRNGFSVKSTKAVSLEDNDARLNKNSGFAWYPEGPSEESYASGNNAIQNEKFGFVLYQRANARLYENTALRNLSSGFSWNGQAAGSAELNYAIGNKSGFVVKDAVGPDLIQNYAEHNEEAGFMIVHMQGGSITDNIAIDNQLDGFFVSEESEGMEYLSNGAIDNVRASHRVLGKPSIASLNFSIPEIDTN